MDSERSLRAEAREGAVGGEEEERVRPRRSIAWVRCVWRVSRAGMWMGSEEEMLIWQAGRVRSWRLRVWRWFGFELLVTQRWYELRAETGGME